MAAKGRSPAPEVVEMPLKWLLLVLAVGASLAAIAFVPRGPGGGSGTDLTPITDWPHTHGLAVDPKNPNLLHIGTHGHGVVRLEIGGRPMRVGNNRLDLMGYSASPVDGRVHYSSGHPGPGGNTGVIKSEDGGLAWKRVDTLPGTPVDFHAMTVSPANPQTLYAWYYGDRRFYRSTDAGVTWTNPAARGLGAGVVALAGDPASEQTVLAGTDSGLYRSADGGESWSPLPGPLDGGPVLAVAIDPKEPRTLYASGQFTGLWKSTDGGATFRISSRGLPAGDAVLFVAIDPTATDKIYASTVSKTIYRSVDGGATWSVLWVPGG
ncbi:MAG: hypothetical protein QXQ87_04490 [Halobacteria archaeon]